MSFIRGMVVVCVIVLLLQGNVKATISQCNNTTECLGWLNLGPAGNQNQAGSGAYFASVNGNGLWGVEEGENSMNAGVRGQTSSSWPSAGVYGTTDADVTGSYGVGVAGVTTSPLSTGVYGSGTSIGTEGDSFTTNGIGIRGVSGAAGGHAIDGICNGSCATGSGYAGYFNGNVYATGTITPGPSDARLKKDVRPLQGALETLLRLQGVSYEWKEPGEHGNQKGIQRGFIAQEVEKVFPEWIGTDGKGLKTISIPGRGLEAFVVESIRELKGENDKLKMRIKELEQDRRSLTSNGLQRKLEGGLALCLLPIGFAVAVRRRKTKETK